VTLVNGRSGEEKIVPLSRLRQQAIERWKKAPVKKDAVWPL
jgi:hypothetical protein